MSTQLIAIILVLVLALLIMFVGWGALYVSAREEEEQERWLGRLAASPSDNSTYPASDDANRNEADNE